MAYLRRSDSLPWVAGVSVAIALLMVMWAIISPDQVGLPGLILVFGVAVIFFIGFYGLATGALRVGKQAEARSNAQSKGPSEAGLFIRVLDDAPEGYLIVNKQGAVIYANHTYEGLTEAGNRARNAGRPLPLEQVFAGDEALAAPLYRLARAARRGERGTETLTLTTIDGETRTFRTTVTPIEGVRDYALYRIVEQAGIGEPSAFERGVEEDLTVSFTDPSQGVTLDADDIVDVVQEHAASGLFENAPLGLIILDEEGKALRLNKATRQLLGQDNVEDKTAFAELIAEQDRSALAERLEDCISGKDSLVPLDTSLAANEEKKVQLFFSHAEGIDGAVVVYLIDTTEHKSLELQMAQSQKMQAVGQLAGGVAHDFNNLLTAIIGFCDLLLTRHHAGDPSFGDIDQIRQNANRAANLVRQLLAFSRQQTLSPTVLSPTDILTDLSMLLRRLLGETVELKVVHGRNLSLLKVDQSQLDTAMINLAVNARDAMPEGGSLTIETSQIQQNEKRSVVEDLVPPGKYVAIEVTDEGTGIPEEVLKKIFDPFFTTKGVGEGTGLGLSTVYGIIKQMDGFIFCDSVVGKGTTFRIYLPEYVETEEDKKAREEETKEVAPRDLTGIGTILLVEDEDAVRAFATRALSSRGYNVLEAANGVEALEIFTTYEDPIDLMVSDVVMPEMDGPTLAKEARALKPETKIIFISGYAEDAFKGTERPENTTFLPKPFSLKQLAEQVKQVLSE